MDSRLLDHSAEQRIAQLEGLAQRLKAASLNEESILQLVESFRRMLDAARQATRPAYRDLFVRLAEGGLNTINDFTDRLREP